MMRVELAVPDEGESSVNRGEFADEIGGVLRSLRARLGMSQPQAAERAEMSLGVYRQYEQGRREPRYSALVRLATGWGLTLGDFHPPAKQPDGPEAERPKRGRPKKAGTKERTRGKGKE
jgi:transcriptional regulator with XRE-family HTH domain